jgi:hypothetical protein
VTTDADMADVVAPTGDEPYVPGDIYTTLNNDVFNIIIVFFGAGFGTVIAGLEFLAWTYFKELIYYLDH